VCVVVSISPPWSCVPAVFTTPVIVDGALSSAIRNRAVVPPFEKK
jgi:hypothetical protein